MDGTPPPLTEQDIESETTQARSFAPRPSKLPLMVQRADGSLAIAKSNAPEAVAERKRRFLEVYATAKSEYDAANQIGIRRSNVTYWKQNDPEFAEALCEVRREVMDKVVLPKIFGLATGAESKDGIPHFQALKWLAERYNPEEFGPRTQVQHFGTIFHTQIPTAVSLDDLDVVEADGYSLPDEADEEDDDA